MNDVFTVRFPDVELKAKELGFFILRREGNRFFLCLHGSTYTNFAFPDESYGYISALEKLKAIEEENQEANTFAQLIEEALDTPFDGHFTFEQLQLIARDTMYTVFLDKENNRIFVIDSFLSKHKLFVFENDDLQKTFKEAAYFMETHDCVTRLRQISEKP